MLFAPSGFSSCPYLVSKECFFFCVLPPLQQMAVNLWADQTLMCCKVNENKYLVSMSKQQELKKMSTHFIEAPKQQSSMLLLYSPDLNSSCEHFSLLVPCADIILSLFSCSFGSVLLPFLFWVFL